MWSSPLLKTRVLILIAVSLAIVAGSSLAARHFWRESALQAVTVADEQRAQLIADRIRSEINRQDHLPLMMALDPDIRDALRNGGDSEAFIGISRKLKLISQEADARSLYVVNARNVVVAADDWEAPTTLVGETLSPRPYFTTAVASGKGAFIDFDPKTDQVRYFVAVAVHAPEVVGVAVARIDFDVLESAWARAGERIMITDHNGLVFLASDARFRQRIMPDLIEAANSLRAGTKTAADNYPGLFRVVERRASSMIVRLENSDATYLYQPLSLPDYGWTVHRLSDISSVQRDARDGALIGGTLSALALSLMFISFQRQRALVAERRHGLRLRAQVAERTRELSDANTLLKGEIDERRSAEERLRQTQNELVQASKLAALGQMSAAIAHEINQPLTAIRTFVASTRVLMDRGDKDASTRNLDLINSLAKRMAEITAHLKMFARKSEAGTPEPVDVAGAVRGSLVLLESQIAEARVAMRLDLAEGIFVMGYTVQLEQVVLNLVRNALDAVAAVENPAVEIAVGRRGAEAVLSVRDNGPGIDPADLRRIFDPFFTTKPIGVGLGLGLSITYGIVQTFGGRILARNREEGGAEIVVELPVSAGASAAVRRVADA